MNISLILKNNYNVIKGKESDYMKKFKPTNKHEKIVITIRIDDYKVEQLDDIANKVNISRNELINQCLDFAIMNIEFKDDDNK